MNRGENSAISIPTDLIPEILSRLPVKSIARLRCVSKLWGFHVSKPYFTELFLKKSSARPLLLIVVRKDGGWFFFSAPQPQNLYYETSSLVLAADFYMKFSKVLRLTSCRYASGLLYLSGFSMEHDARARVICNPSTGQVSILPQTHGCCLLGFDPIGRQFKVLSMNNMDSGEETHCILTLGTEKVRWRNIQCPSRHDVARVGTCINGVLYYIAYDFPERLHLIYCFDVRTEKFKFLNLKPPSIWNNLINYKGKLGMIDLEYDDNGGFSLKICMWVLEDVEKHEWSTYVYTLRAENDFGKVYRNVSVVGVTALGEIILAKDNPYKPFYVFYFNPERNTLLTVEIQGVGEDHEWFFHELCVFVDHVEDLYQFNIMKTTSTSPPEQKRRRTSTSRSSKTEHHVSASTSSRRNHQARIVAYPRQDRDKIVVRLRALTNLMLSVF